MDILNEYWDKYHVHDEYLISLLRRARIIDKEDWVLALCQGFQSVKPTPFIFTPRTGLDFGLSSAFRWKLMSQFLFEKKIFGDLILAERAVNGLNTGQSYEPEHPSYILRQMLANSLVPEVVSLDKFA